MNRVAMFGCGTTGSTLGLHGLGEKNREHPSFECWNPLNGAVSAGSRETAARRMKGLAHWPQGELLRTWMGHCPDLFAYPYGFPVTADSNF